MWSVKTRGICLRGTKTLLWRNQTNCPFASIQNVTCSTRYNMQPVYLPHLNSTPHLSGLSFSACIHVWYSSKMVYGITMRLAPKKWCRANRTISAHMVYLCSDLQPVNNLNPDGTLMGNTSHHWCYVFVSNPFFFSFPFSNKQKTRVDSGPCHEEFWLKID